MAARLQHLPVKRENQRLGDGWTNQADQFATLDGGAVLHQNLRQPVDAWLTHARHLEVRPRRESVLRCRTDCQSVLPRPQSTGYARHPLSCRPLARKPPPRILLLNLALPDRCLARKEKAMQNPFLIGTKIYLRPL